MSRLLLKPSSLLDVDFHPEALAVEAILPAFVLALHGVVALVEVFVGAAPGVVDAHGVVGGDGAVDEAEDAVFGFGLGAQAAQFIEGVGIAPEFKDVLFELDEVYFVGYVFEAHCFLHFGFRISDFGLGRNGRSSLPSCFVLDVPGGYGR
jgi:hypothetical protein